MTQSELSKEIIESIKKYNKANNCIVEAVRLDNGEIEHSNGSFEATYYTCFIMAKSNGILTIKQN